MRYDVHLVDAQPQPTMEVNGTIGTDEITDFLGAAFRDTAVAAARQQLPISGPPFARWVEGDQGGWVAVAGFPVAGSPVRDGRVQPGSLPGGRQARTIHVGAYDAVGAAYQAIADWLSEHGLVPAGDAYETYLDEPDVVAPRTEVSMPCAPAVPAADR